MDLLASGICYEGNEANIIYQSVWGTLYNKGISAVGDLYQLPTVSPPFHVLTLIAQIYYMGIYIYRKKYQKYYLDLSQTYIIYVLLHSPTQCN